MSWLVSSSFQPEYRRHLNELASQSNLVFKGLDIGFVNLLVQNYEAAVKGDFFYSLFGALIAPVSRGTVKLASADPLVLPAIDPAFLTSKTDQTLAVEIFRKIRRIFNTPSFKSVRRDNNEYFPGQSPQWP